MGGIRIFASAALAVVGFMSCESTDRIDLAHNAYIYRSPEYKAPRRAAETVFIQPLKDLRVAPDRASGSGYRAVYSDDDWDRPVPVMVEELLVDEIDRAGIYGGISIGDQGHPRAGDIVIEPSLLAMYRMSERPVGPSGVEMRRTVASTALRLRVSGPVDASGSRPVLLDEVFHQQFETEPSLARPEKGVILSGRTMSKIMATALPKLYQANAADPAARPAAHSPTDPSGSPATK
jgi:hypothetical protein